MTSLIGTGKRVSTSAVATLVYVRHRLPDGVVILMEEQSISNSLQVALERAKFRGTSAVPWITKHSVSTLIAFGIVRHRLG